MQPEKNYLSKPINAFSGTNRYKNSTAHEVERRISKLLKSMAIHSETFTSLTEFVKNHLVKINKISVSLSKTVSLISQRSKDFKLCKPNSKVCVR